MESTNSSSVAPDLSLHSHCGSRLLLLPKELRLKIYRHVLVVPDAPSYRDGRANPNNQVSIMSRNHISDTSALNSFTKYVCDRDLGILQTSQQVREEAGDVFYRGNVFTLYLCMPDEAYEAKLRSVMFYSGLNYVDLRRIRQCHISSAPCMLLRFLYDSDAETLLWKYFNQFAKAMSRLPGHEMQDLLIECYHFEVAAVGAVGGRRTVFGPFVGLENMIEDLKMVRGIKHVHIRALNPELWPDLRDLEILMTSSETSESKMEGIDTSARKLATIETHENRESAAEELFRRFAVLPLYRNTDFMHVL